METDMYKTPHRSVRINRRRWRYLIGLLLLAGPSGYYLWAPGPQPKPEPVDPLLARLKRLPTLPKVHYCWPIAGDLLLGDDPRLLEYARITRSVGIRGEKISRETVEAAVKLCRAVGGGAGKKGRNGWMDGSKRPTIAVNYSPWHRVWPKELPPTDTGAEHDQEIALYRRDLRRAEEWLRATWTGASRINVSVLLLDSERFSIKKGTEPGCREWNAAITAKLNAFYDIGKQIFPDARVEWYGRGTARTRFTPDVKGDGYATWLYEVPDEGYTRKKMRSVRRRCLEAVGVCDGSVMPWVALGAGYRRYLTEDGAVKQAKWAHALEYPVSVSYRLGADVNGSAPPWDVVNAVTLYPNPCSEKTPYWLEHFIEYVKGASGR
jgi:hypothetical protein